MSGVHTGTKCKVLLHQYGVEDGLRLTKQSLVDTGPADGAQDIACTKAMNSTKLIHKSLVYPFVSLA